MFAHKVISYKVRGPTRSETLEILKCGSTANAACIFCTRFERVIHSISADLALHKLLFFFPYAILVAHQSERRACVRIKTSFMRVKDLSAICDWTKKKKKIRRYFNFHFAKLWNDLWFRSSPSKFSLPRKTTLWLRERHFRLFHRSLWKISSFLNSRNNAQKISNNIDNNNDNKDNFKRVTLIKGKLSNQILFFLFLPFLSYKIIKRLMITFPFPNIDLSFGYICCCRCCVFFFFLSVLYVKQITGDAVYMIQFYIEKYLKELSGSICCNEQWNMADWEVVRKFCVQFTPLHVCQITHKKLSWQKSKLKTSVGLEILDNRRSSAICRV